MQIRPKQAPSLHHPPVQLCIFSPPFGLGLLPLVPLVLLVLLVLLMMLQHLLLYIHSPQSLHLSG